MIRPVDGVLYAAVAMGVAVGAYALTDCTPAQGANVENIPALVLADLAQGKTVPQIEADVAKLLAGQLGADADVIVEDAIVLLVDAGVIPASVLPFAKSTLTQVRVQMLTRAAGSIAPAVTQ